MSRIELPHAWIRAKARLRRTGPRFWGRRPRVLVASIPRCGSTLLFRAAAGWPMGSTFPRHCRRCAFLPDFSEIPDRPFLKTHYPAPPELPADIRVIFLFGDPVRAVLSTLNNRHTWGHFRYCGYDGDEWPDIYNEDALGYEHIFDSWTAAHDYPVLAMRFERLWAYQSLVEDFIERPLALPPFRARSTEPPREQVAHLRQAYSGLVEKVSAAPDLCVHGGRKG